MTQGRTTDIQEFKQRFRAAWNARPGAAPIAADAWTISEATTAWAMDNLTPENAARIAAGESLQAELLQ